MAITGTYEAWLPRDPDIFEKGTLYIAEAASCTAKRGTPGLYSAGGYAAACTTAPTSIGFVFAEDAHNITTSGTKSVLVWPLRATSVWRITITDALTQAMLGVQEFGVVQDTVTGYWYGSTADAGSQCRVLDYAQGPSGFSIGDSKARVYVEFHYTKIQVV